MINGADTFEELKRQVCCTVKLDDTTSRAGKVDFRDFTGWATVPGETNERGWTRVVWAPHCARFLRVVVTLRLNK